MPDTERDARTTTDETAGEDAAEATQASDDSADTASAQSAESAADQDPGSATTTPTGAATDGTDDEAGKDDDGEDEAGEAGAAARNWPLIAMGAVALVAVAALLVAALAWPGFLTRPGSPDGQGARAAAALSDKNAAEVDAVSCRDQQGNPTNPLPPQALQMIDSARAAGPVRMVLDTQAEVPVDITISAQGQTQTLPASVVMAVTDHQWCMAGISERQ